MAWNNTKRRVKFEANEARFAEKCRGRGSGCHIGDQVISIPPSWRDFYV